MKESDLCGYADQKIYYGRVEIHGARLGFV